MKFLNLEGNFFLLRWWGQGLKIGRDCKGLGGVGRHRERTDNQPFPFLLLDDFFPSLVLLPSFTGSILFIMGSLADEGVKRYENASFHGASSNRRKSSERSMWVQ